jgi:hypothetical protein
MHIHGLKRFRAQTYCWSQDGRTSLTEPVDVFANSIDEAAVKYTGGGISERGNISKLAAKVWDLKGDIRRYYRS